MLSTFTDAARAAHVSVRTVQRMVASGALPVTDDRLVDVERVRSLASVPRSRWLSLAPSSLAVEPSPRFDSSVVELLRLELQRTVEERDRLSALYHDSARVVAGLNSELEASARVELATSRRCDRLEVRLHEAHRESLALARHVGSLEADRASLARLTAPRSRSFLSRLFSRSTS